MRTEPFPNLKGWYKQTWPSEDRALAPGPPKTRGPTPTRRQSCAPARLLSCSHGEDRTTRSQRTHSAPMVRSRARANMTSPRPVAQRVCHGGRDWSAQNEGCTLSTTKPSCSRPSRKLRPAKRARRCSGTSDRWQASCAHQRVSSVAPRALAAVWRPSFSGLPARP